MNQKKVARLFIENIPIILASSSPRRHQLMKKVGIVFDTVSVENEPLPLQDELPETYVMRAAETKAFTVAANNIQAVIIAADTVIVQNDGTNLKIIGKPSSDDDALTMLTELQGGRHQVFTGCCVVWPIEVKPHGIRYETFYDSTYISFGKWSQDVLRTYIKTGEPKDKAGAFSIEGIGGFLIDVVDGNFTTVLGLPLPQLLKCLLLGGAITIASQLQREEV